MSAKRAKRIAKEKERARIAAVELVERYSGLVSLRNDELQDQLKAWKLKLGKDSSFAISMPNRKAYVLQLQTIIYTDHTNPCRQCRTIKEVPFITR